MAWRMYGIAALLCASLWAQNYPRLHVHEIMTLPPDSLAVGSLLSPRLGDTVLLVGVVTVPPVLDPVSDRRPLLWAGVRWVTFLRDSNPELTAYAGINVLQADTTVTSTYFDRIRPGDYIEVLVRITNFPTSADPVRNRLGPTQAEVITGAAARPVEFLDYERPLPQPIPVRISDFYTGPVGSGVPNIASGSRYVGMLVELHNVTVVANQPVIVLSDDQGNQMYMRDQSGYFTTRAHRLREFVPYPVGQRIRRIRGYITASTVGGQPQVVHAHARVSGGRRAGDSSTGDHLGEPRSCAPVPQLCRAGSHSDWGPPWGLPRERGAPGVRSGAGYHGADGSGAGRHTLPG
jgi:hypothetical protein